MRRLAWKEVLLSLATITVVLMVLIGLNAHLRSEVKLRYEANPKQQLVDAGQHASSVTSVLMRAVRNKSMAHQPMVIFVVAAGVLTVFMLRT